VSRPTGLRAGSRQGRFPGMAAQLPRSAPGAGHAAAAWAASAVVHCSRWRWLTKMRYSARPMASAASRACVQQQSAMCHSAAQGAQPVGGHLRGRSGRRATCRRGWVLPASAPISGPAPKAASTSSQCAPGRRPTPARVRQQQRQRGRRHQRAAQVVQYLPAVDGAQRPAPWRSRKGSSCQSPRVQRWRRDAATSAWKGASSMSGDVAERGAARQRAFQQVVAEHAAFGQAAAQHGVHGPAREAGPCRRSCPRRTGPGRPRRARAVGVDAALACKQPMEGRALALGQRQRVTRRGCRMP
jgi:hypothetical protein